MALVSFRTAVYVLAVFAFFAVLDQYKHHMYIFDPVKLQAISRANIAKNLSSHETFHGIVNDLAKAYPGHIREEEDWVFNVAAGAMGQFWLLHGSITEYLIIFGTPIGTEGHTGRYLADDYFIILKGEQWGYSQGQIERQVWRPGDMHLMARGEAKGYKIPEYGYALEYARGWIPTMLPIGFADVFTSNLDFQIIGKTVFLYAKSFFIEAAQGKL